MTKETAAKSTDRSTLVGTQALKRFIDEHRRLGELLAFILTLAATIDNNRKIAIKALADPDDIDLDGRIKKVSQDGAVAAFAKHFLLTKEMLVCRAVDSYLCYLTELMSTIFRTKPETLRSGEQIRIDRVLAFDSMDDLISHIADKKINELAYQSMLDLKIYFKEKLGFDLFDNNEQERTIVQVVLLRNLLVHTRGIINERFLKACPEYAGNVGDEIKLGTEQTFDIVNTLVSNVQSIDKRAHEKYSLPNLIEFEFADIFLLIRPSKVRDDLA